MRNRRFLRIPSRRAGTVLGGVFLFLVALGAVAFWVAQSFRSEAPIAIRIGEERITAQEFEELYREFLKERRASLPPSERPNFEKDLVGAPGAHYQLQLKLQLAEQLIQERLLARAARERGISVPQSEVLERVKLQLWRFLEANGVPPEQIEQALNDPKTYRSEFTRGLIERTRRAMLEEKLRADVAGVLQPSEEELRAYYERYRLRYYTPELVHVRHILVRVPPDAEPERVERARRRIEEIRERLREGERFEELARRYSEDELSAPQGGDYGWIQRGDPTGEAFVELAFSLKEPGEVGGPVRTERGFHLVQLVERRPEQGETFEEVADRVLRDYLLEKTQERFREWFDAYREEVGVEILDPLLVAIRLEFEDSEAALRQYERIQEEGLSDDPYLGYYIAALYRPKLEEVERRLRGAEGPERGELQAQAEELRRKIAENLKDVLAKGRREAEIYRALLETTPEDHEVRYEYARWLLANGRWDDAARQLRILLEGVPDHVAGLVDYGDLLAQMGEPAQALKHLERALSLMGSDSGSGPEGDEAQAQAKKLRRKALRARARAYAQLGEQEKARSAWQEVLKEDPGDLEANRALGELLLGEGRYGEALPHLERALRSAPPEEKPEIWVLLGEAHQGNGDAEAAEEAFRNALGSKEAPRAHLGLGQLAERRGDAPKAREHYRQGFEQAVGWDLKERLGLALLALSPEETAVRFELARLYERRKRFEDAVRQYQEILRYEPRSFPAWFRLGEAYLAQKRPLKAVEALEKALENAASPQERSGVWGRIVQAERLRSERSGEKLSPKGLEALYQLAQVLVEMGSYRRAAERLAELRAEDPTYRQEDVERLIARLKEQGVELPSSSSPSSSAP